MFRTILVPINGSRFAEAALPLAAQLARSAQARLHLVLAHQPVAALVGLGEAVIPPSGLEEDVRAQEQAYLADRAVELAPLLRRTVEFQEVEGPPGPAVCEEASRLDADLIVMATHGRGAVGRLWLGSVADYVVRHAAIPVLLVHPGSKESEAASSRHSILVALDLSPQSEAILEPVVCFAHLREAHVTLVHVVEWATDMAKDRAFAESTRTEAQRKLDRIADRMRERGVSVSTRVMFGADVARILLEELKEARFDLLAMTTHGVGGLRRMLVGRIADQLLRKSGKPLLLLRPPPVI